MNFADIIVLLLVTLLVAACIRSLTGGRRSKTGSCSGTGCSGCGMSCTCALGKRDMKKVG